MRRFHAARPLLAVLFLVSSAWAGHRTAGGVHVHGYTTRSGHYVAPYTRSAPHTYHAPALPRASHPSTHASSLTSHPSTRAAVGVNRDSHGRIKRSESAKLAFERHHPCPSTGKT